MIVVHMAMMVGGNCQADGFYAEPEFTKMMDFEARGIPYGRAAEVTLRNNHAQYIFTW